jgi:phosphoribosylaminoimidazolecarboxamide formyltransferase / IMP cyclohydrolase
VVSQRPIRRALISVYDKTGLEELASGLAEAGVEIVSTGSTARRIAEAGVPVTEVEAVTGFPECLDGRVKTLHPGIHAGLLADQGNAEHAAALQELGLEPFDLLVVNLYPFSATVASGAGPADCVEKIDIGGPAMIRAAAKNHASTAVVVEPSHYAELLKSVHAGGFSEQARRRLAAQAFAHTAAYDAAVADWFAETYAPDEAAVDSGWPDFTAGVYERVTPLRYGENPHQSAALYRAPGGQGLASAGQLHGKEMSYNNYVDADAALRAAFDFVEPCVAIIKHANPCGIALGGDLAEAHRKAHACDPVSAFGGVIAANGTVTAAMAEQVAEVFTEVVVAPDFDEAAVDLLTTKKNVRLLKVDAPARGAPPERRAISGGLLMQAADLIDTPGDVPAGWELRAGQPAAPEVLADLEFAWRAVRSVKSNAILLSHERAAVGVGMGQVNRVDSARLAVTRAADRARGAVAASDAFFPFPDGLEVLIEAGISAVVQPGGSVRDEDVIAAGRRPPRTI